MESSGEVVIFGPVPREACAASLVLFPILSNCSRQQSHRCYNSLVEKRAVKFADLAEAEKADREFYRKLTGQERLDILLEMTKEATSRPLERVVRIIKLSDDRGSTY